MQCDSPHNKACMTRINLVPFFSFCFLTLQRALKQTYVDLALEEIRKERAGISPPPELKSASRMQSPKKTPAKVSAPSNRKLRRIG